MIVLYALMMMILIHLLYHQREPLSLSTTPRSPRWDYSNYGYKLDQCVLS